MIFQHIFSIVSIYYGSGGYCIILWSNLYSGTRTFFIYETLKL